MFIRSENSFSSQQRLTCWNLLTAFHDREFKVISSYRARVFSLLLKSKDKMLDDSLHFRGVSDLCPVYPGSSVSLCPEWTHSPGWPSSSHVERAHTHGFGRTVLREDKCLTPKASLGLSLFHEKKKMRAESFYQAKARVLILY